MEHLLCFIHFHLWSFRDSTAFTRSNFKNETRDSTSFTQSNLKNETKKNPKAGKKRTLKRVKKEPWNGPKKNPGQDRTQNGWNIYYVSSIFIFEVSEIRQPLPDLISRTRQKRTLKKTPWNGSKKNPETGPKRTLKRVQKKNWNRSKKNPKTGQKRALLQTVRIEPKTGGKKPCPKETHSQQCHKQTKTTNPLKKYVKQ